MTGRKEFVEGCDLSPDSLVGSWFHRIDEGVMVQQGVVVGEVQAGVYLCEVGSMLPGEETFQRIVDLKQMARADEVEWRFYDSHEAMCDAFVRYTATAREEV